ncbi:hypothetical protein AB6A40_006981 [Gnathostoma spinigerum]|uniref:HDAg domain-containing protein n=1 Tax=Gnathostoma spinigerum TaxID=75299 RepID=A0ABD6EUM9_9BILA
MMTPSSQLRDLDLVKWLDNKLGDNSELWSGRQAASLLSREMLVELETCFQALEPHVKLKIILAMPHLSYRLMAMWRGPLLNLLELARRDADDWIETVSDMYRDYPNRRSIMSVPSNPESYFCRTLNELRKIIKKHANDGTLRLLPLDTSFVSHSAIKLRYGVSEIDVRKHFNLRRRAKSSTLRAELLKSSDALRSPSKNQKNSLVAPSFPIRMRSTARKPNNDLPMRGIPTVNTCKLSAGFTNEPKKFQRHLAKREGGAKLIDIGEIPHTLRRRRRDQENEERAKRLVEKEEQRKHAKVEKTEKKNRRKCAVSMSSNDSSVNHGGSKLSLDVIVNSCLIPTTVVVGCSDREASVSEQTKSSEQSETPSYADVRERPTMGNEPSKSSSLLMPRTDVRELSIRRQCEEMLSSANALDIQGHRMVSAFMSGNKVHPLPHMGDIVTLKLSQMFEDETRPDGSTQKQRVETFLQMDYRTGEWKRLKKTRVLRPEEVNALQMAEIGASKVVTSQTYS